MMKRHVWPQYGYNGKWYVNYSGAPARMPSTPERLGDVIVDDDPFEVVILFNRHCPESNVTA